MAADAGEADVPYEESVEYAWTEKAFSMLESGALQGEVVSRDGVVRSRVWGTCPRCQECGHQIDDRQTLTAVTNLMGRDMAREPRVARAGSEDSWPRSLSRWMCRVAAEGPIPGGPTGSTGCGVSFRVELPVHRADAGGGE